MPRGYRGWFATNDRDAPTRRTTAPVGREYMRLLAPLFSSPCQYKGYLVRQGVTGWSPSRPRPPQADFVREATSGSWELHPVDVQNTMLIVLDVDLHREDDDRPLRHAAALHDARETLRASEKFRESGCRALAKYEGTGPGKSWRSTFERRFRREEYQRSLGAAVVRLRALLPTVPIFIEESHRGVHLIVPLARATETVTAASIAAHLAEALRPHLPPLADVESFPRANGSMCRAPLTGGVGRLLDPDDLSKPLYSNARGGGTYLTKAPRVADRAALAEAGIRIGSKALRRRLDALCDRPKRAARPSLSVADCKTTAAAFVSKTATLPAAHKLRLVAEDCDGQQEQPTNQPPLYQEASTHLSVRKIEVDTTPRDRRKAERSGDRRGEELDAAARARWLAGEKLYGDDFGDLIDWLAREGIPSGMSFHAVNALCYALYADDRELTLPQALEACEALLAHPKSEATHCLTPQGRRVRLRQFRSFWKRLTADRWFERKLCRRATRRGLVALLGQERARAA